MKSNNSNSKPRKCICCDNILSGRYQLKYCSRSCSAKINNKLYIKKIRSKGSCRFCGKKTSLKRIKNCEKCIRLGRHKKCGLNFENLTIKDILKRNNRYGPIRTHAQQIYKNINKICENCGYSKHVHICHRIPINKFRVNTTIKTINSRENILFLCPNCHWEFDNKGLPPAGFKPASCPSPEHPLQGSEYKSLVLSLN